jgi:hypothetical protein
MRVGLFFAVQIRRRLDAFCGPTQTRSSRSVDDSVDSKVTSHTPLEDPRLCCSLSDSNGDQLRQRLDDRGEDVGMAQAAKMRDQEGSCCIAKLHLAIRSGAHAEHKS